MSISVVQGDVIGWRVRVTEDGQPKDLTGATVSAALLIGGTVHPLEAALVNADTAADVVVDTSDVEEPGSGVLQCRFALAGEVRTAALPITIRLSAFDA